mmetsp:Transcript_25550/g.61548  ORF Transcript_25550/g.61548 Transcript_25550/m.61548 type:complete len:104 (-) Transcript_25550:103-414(-)
MIISPNSQGQITPGKPHKPGKEDSKANRVGFFRAGLQAAFELDAKHISLPYAIGCGLAGGKWPQYLQLIHEIALKHPEKQVTIYKLPKHKMEAFKASMKKRKR